MICWRSGPLLFIHRLLSFYQSVSLWVYRKLIFRSIILKHTEVWLGMLIIEYKCLIFVSDGLDEEPSTTSCLSYLVWNNIKLIALYRRYVNTKLIWMTFLVYERWDGLWYECRGVIMKLLVMLANGSTCYLVGSQSVGLLPLLGY